MVPRLDYHLAELRYQREVIGVGIRWLDATPLPHVEYAGYVLITDHCLVITAYWTLITGSLRLVAHSVPVRQGGTDV